MTRRSARSGCCWWSSWRKRRPAPPWRSPIYSLGVPLAALVPVVYQVLTVVSVIVFLVTRNFERFRFQQALIIFLGPIALHYFLGGFVNSSGVILSAFLAPLIAILFHGGRQSWPWFVALWIVLLVLAAADSTLAAQAHMLPDSARVVFLLFHIGGVGSVIYAGIRYHASLLDAEKAEQVSLNERLTLTASELSLTLAAARGDERRARRGRTAEIPLPRQHVSRAAHTAQCHHRL